MVPHTMANETAQKATWNRNLAESGTCVHESPAYTSLTCPAGTARNQPSVPISALPVPKASANPTAQNNRAAMARLTSILATTLPTFFIREKPTSSIANPACMKRTRQAVTITQTVSIASERSAVEGPSWANASPGNASTNNRTTVESNASLRKSFLLESRGYVLLEPSLGTGPRRVFSRMYKDGCPARSSSSSGCTRQRGSTLATPAYQHAQASALACQPAASLR